MDTWLIFHDFCDVRWEDTVQYVLRIIGFAFMRSDGVPGKSGILLQCDIKTSEDLAIRQRK